MASALIDLSKKLGKIKPVHGVNSGPRTKVFTYNASALFSEIGIPYSRLHDVEYPYGSGEFVDIHCVFPNFDADENDPASYNFGLTDCYIKAALDVGTDIIYRLGESIEHAPVKRHIFPPKDFAKWARVAEHIIRHYNEGWADGHRWNITYWEIWNEPDLNSNNPSQSTTWQGTPEQFWDLYEITAKHLKSCFPDLKIGGPALAGKYQWADRFLHAMQSRNVPMDFFSWHIYTGNPRALSAGAAKYRALMDDCGYENAEMLLDEWNYMESWSSQPDSFRKLVGIRGAAFCAASLIEMQKSSVDVGAYFEADVIKEWCGLFEVEGMAIGFQAASQQGKLKPRKPFVSFRDFGKLYRIGAEVFSESDNENVYVCAASNENEACALIAVRDMEEGICEIVFENVRAGWTVSVIKTDQNGMDIPVGSFTASSDRLQMKLPFDGDTIFTVLKNA